MKKLVLFSWVFLLVIVSQSAYAQRPHRMRVPIAPMGWEMLGERVVDFGIDRDVIPVTAARGEFRAIKLICRRGAMNLYRCEVRFANGDVQDITFNHDFRNAIESPVIDLRGNERIIRNVVLVYSTKGYARRRAIVELWGMH